MRLISAQSSLMRSGALLLAAAAFSAAAVLVLFDWKPVPMLTGAAIGVVLWGGISFLTEVRDAIPGSGALPPAPPDADIRAERGLNPWLLLLIPACLGLAWLADRWDL